MSRSAIAPLGPVALVLLLLTSGCGDVKPLDVEEEVDGTEEVVETRVEEPTPVEGVDVQDIEEDVSPVCGPLEELQDTGECGCIEDTCYDVTVDACIDQWWSKDWGKRAVDLHMLAQVRRDLLSEYTDVSKMEQRIEVEIDDMLENIVDSPIWSALGIGYLAFADHLCALYQLGTKTSDNPLAALALEDLAKHMEPKAWMAVILMGVVSNQVDRCIVNRIIQTMENELIGYALIMEQDPESWPDKPGDNEVKVGILRYLLTVDLFDKEPLPGVLETFADYMYPGGVVTLGETLSTGTVMDVLWAAFLDLEWDPLGVQELLAQAWTGTYFTLEDCPADTQPLCKAKSYHRVVNMDMYWGFVPQDYLMNMAAFMLADMNEETGAYGFLAKLDLDEDALFSPSYCSVFCSAKHWHMTLVLNHSLKRLQGREEELKAKIAEIEAQ